MTEGKNANPRMGFMKTVCVVLSIIVSQVAFAERFLVTFKNHQIHQELVVQGRRAENSNQLQSFLNSKGYALTAENIQTHLEAVNSVVVKDLSSTEAESLKANRDVLYVEKEFKHPLSFPLKAFKKQLAAEAPYRFYQQETPWGIKALHSQLTWNATSGGVGARVLILDTGIDRDHPSVRPNLIDAKDFIGDSQTGYSYRDSIGHGTHVAGTIAGVLDKSGFSGVAPTASILAGRVCAEDGCSNISIVQGLNWAVEQKVDVVSMSLSGAYSSLAERFAIHSAYRSGITIVAAAGNDGSDTIGYPAALPECIAVGAVDSDLKRAEFSQYGPELAVVAPGVDVVSSVPLGTGRESMVNFSIAGEKFKKVKSALFQGSKTVTKALVGELVFAGYGAEADFKDIDVKGKIALIQRGDLKFSEKIANAIKANAAGAIVFNNVPGMINGTLTEDGSEVEISAYMVEQTVGEAWVAALKAGTPVTTQSAAVITNYSSYNGTSMATPHVSGVVALMKAANPNLSPDDVRAILMGTAQKLTENDKNQTGAGLVQADQAVMAALQYGGASAAAHP